MTIYTGAYYESSPGANPVWKLSAAPGPGGLFEHKCPAPGYALLSMPRKSSRVACSLLMIGVRSLVLRLPFLVKHRFGELSHRLAEQIQCLHSRKLHNSTALPHGVS